MIYQVQYDDSGDAPRYRLPDVVRGDGRAVPRPDTRPLPAHGLRHRRVGPGLHDHLARARLRLPGRDPLRRRRAPRHAGRAVHDHQRRSASTRRTTPSSGSTSTSNAGAEVRRMRRLVVSCHATVANYEYLIYWRFYQDGNIECEVRATGIMVTTPFAEGADAPPYGHGRRPRGRMRRSTSTSSWRGSTSTSTASRTPCSRSTRLAAPIGAGQPVRARRCDTGDTRAQRVRGGPRLRLGRRSGPGRSSTPRPNAHGDPVAYKLVPTACDPADDGSRRRRSTCGRRSSATSSG